jgi:hypothetical protein
MSTMWRLSPPINPFMCITAQMGNNIWTSARESTSLGTLSRKSRQLALAASDSRTIS